MNPVVTMTTYASTGWPLFVLALNTVQVVATACGNALANQVIAVTATANSFQAETDDDLAGTSSADALIVEEQENSSLLLPSEETFARLAHEAPAQLIAWMRSSMPPAQLTYAAERLGKGNPGQLGLALLIELLRHDKAYVREGAIYGLANHVAHPNVISALRGVVQEDQVPGLRELAAELLES
jgi:hypothetical protein